MGEAKPRNPKVLTLLLFCIKNIYKHMKNSELKAYIKTVSVKDLGPKEFGQIITTKMSHLMGIKKVLTQTAWEATSGYIFTERNNPTNEKILQKFEESLEKNRIEVLNKMKELGQEDSEEPTQKELDEAEEIMKRRGLA